MPAYQSTPFKKTPPVMIIGHPEYLWGSYDDRSSPTFGYIISDSAASTTGTVVFLVTSGPVPIAGDLITVRSSRSANLNVVNATVITSVPAADAQGIQNGVVTVTYAITSTTLASAADSGQVECVRAEVGEVLAAGASIPVAVSFSNANTEQERGLTAVVSFPSLPTSVIVTLQQAVFDKDSEYADVASVVTVAGGVVTVGGQITVDPVLGRFFRFNNGTVVGGTNPTIVAKLLS